MSSSKVTLHKHPDGSWKPNPPSYLQQFVGLYLPKRPSVRIIWSIIFASGVLAGQFSYDWAIADEEGLMIITDQPGQEVLLSEEDTVRLPTTHEDIQITATKNSVYAYWLWYLKSREGYVYKAYKCPAGKTTVGYGHNMDAHGLEYCGKYLNNKQISYKAATKLLVEDAQREYNRLIEIFPHLKREQALAVTALLLNCGAQKIKYTKGNKKKGISDFWKKLQNKETPNFLPYCHYVTPEGKTVKSPNLVDARKFEQALFVGDLETVRKKAIRYQQTIVHRDIPEAKKHDLLN